MIKGIPVSDLGGGVSEDILRKLQSDGIKTVKAWGLSYNNDLPGGGRNSKTWEKLNVGDKVIFYGSKKLFSHGVVLSKFKNRPLAEMWWGRDSKGNTWDLIFLIKDLVETDVQWNPARMGYGDKHVVQGATLYDLSGSKGQELWQMLLEGQKQK
jgi:hypothetical protein